MTTPSQPTTPDELAELIHQLTKHVELLWHAVDDLREEIFVEFAQLRGEPLDENVDRAVTPPFQLKCMPRDPCDPDFHRKVNVAASATPSTEQQLVTPVTLDEFLARLTAQLPAEVVSSDSWRDGQKLPAGTVVEIDEEIFDWFESSMAVVAQVMGRHVLADGDIALYVLWCADERCFVRRMNAAETDAFKCLNETALSQQRSQTPNSSASSAPDRPKTSQQVLW